MRRVAVHGGNDWYDASADYLIVPDEVDLNAAQERWYEWYEGEYCPSITYAGPAVPYRSFVAMLVEDYGCKVDDEIEIFEE